MYGNVRVYQTVQTANAQIEIPKAINIFAVLNPFILMHIGRITVALNVRAKPNIYT